MSQQPFRTKKSLGQHFLSDGNVIRKIIEFFPANAEDWVLEIGPGTGALTQYLWPRYPKLEVVEIDTQAIEVLQQSFDGLVVHHRDILKLDWEEIIPKSQPNYVIGNLPYYITSPILFALLEHRHHFQGALLMMQKEVAKRLVAQPRTKDYGILSVQTQLLGTPEYLFDVQPGSFNPPPKVTSAMVYVHFDKPQLPCSDKMLKTVVRTAFNQRRKKLSNALKSLIEGFEPTDFDLSVRAEEWSPDIYAEFAQQLERSRR
jgi:16S rRNA (adenine1518-N6/adenine1519-N6)-dimethyltransferase